MDIIDFKKIQKMVTKKNFYVRSFILVLGMFILGLNYNLFLSPNKFVIGGISGLAIIVEYLFSIPSSVFIFIASILLLIISFLTLGWKDTRNSIVGSLLYPFFVSVTGPLAKIILPYLEFDSIIIVVLIAGILCGVGNGLIYKTGFNTGGSDIIMKIVNKYGKIPEGKAVLYVNLIMMLFAITVFGIPKFVYSLIILFIMTVIIDRILIGISNSKLFFIYTKEVDSVKNFILNDLKTGVTVLDARGGYSKEKSDVLMCVVPTRKYYLVKETILAIDPSAFFVINDCYEVSGGVKDKKFLDLDNME